MEGFCRFASPGEAEAAKFVSLANGLIEAFPGSEEVEELAGMVAEQKLSFEIITIDLKEK